MSTTFHNLLTTSVNGASRRDGRMDVTYSLIYNTFAAALTKATAVPGMPDAITSGPLAGLAFLPTSYVRIFRDDGWAITDTNVLFVPGRLRVILAHVNCHAHNVLYYAWSPDTSTPPSGLDIHAVFPNVKQCTQGDFVDIDLPDSTSFPTLYLCLLLATDGWHDCRRKFHPTNIVWMLTPRHYLCTDPAMSTYDRGVCHAIGLQGHNYEYLPTSLGFAFEDRHMTYPSDKDYYDVIVLLTSPSFCMMETGLTSFS